MFFIAYAFKGLVHLSVERVKIVSNLYKCNIEIFLSPDKNHFTQWDNSFMTAFLSHILSEHIQS